MALQWSYSVSNRRDPLVWIVEFATYILGVKVATNNGETWIAAAYWVFCPKKSPEEYPGGYHALQWYSFLPMAIHAAIYWYFNYSPITTLVEFCMQVVKI